MPHPICPFAHHRSQVLLTPIRLPPAQRIVFYINDENIIECVAYYEDVDSDWQDTELGKLVGIKTSAKSMLSAVVTSDGAQILAYENPRARWRSCYTAQAAARTELLYRLFSPPLGHRCG